MNLSVSDSAALPLYQQIYDQIAADIVRGEIPGGAALPPIRTVAAELRISVISVKRAWEELERDGYIVTAVGRGTFAAALTAEQRRQMRRRLIEERLAPGLAFCRRLGADAGEIEAAVRAALEENTP